MQAGEVLLTTKKASLREDRVLWMADNGSQWQDDAARITPVSYTDHVCEADECDEHVAAALLYGWVRLTQEADWGCYEKYMDAFGDNLLSDELIAEVLAKACSE